MCGIFAVVCFCFILLILRGYWCVCLPTDFFSVELIGTLLVGCDFFSANSFYFCVFSLAGLWVLRCIICCKHLSINNHPFRSMVFMFRECVLRFLPSNTSHKRDNNRIEKEKRERARVSMRDRTCAHSFDRSRVVFQSWYWTIVNFWPLGGNLFRALWLALSYIILVGFFFSSNSIKILSLKHNTDIWRQITRFTLVSNINAHTHTHIRFLSYCQFIAQLICTSTHRVPCCFVNSRNTTKLSIPILRLHKHF